MKILVIAATNFEIDPLPTLLENCNVDFIATGAGTPSTIINLSKKLCFTHYDIALNIGICGSFSKEASIGDVFEVEEDCFADLGIESEDSFTFLDKSTFCPEDLRSFSSKKKTHHTKLPKTQGYTFNTVHGRNETILSLGITSGIETMEGAAVSFCCHNFGLKLIQIRAVSNFVEKRNTDTWDIPQALKNLHKTIVNDIIPTLRTVG